MTIEVLPLGVPRKSPDISDAEYLLLLGDGRSASKMIERRAIQLFLFILAPGRGKDGHDAKDPMLSVEHKMVTKNAYCRRSEFTGANRIILPDDVIECCNTTYIFSCVTCDTPFAACVTADTIKEWLKLGHIDPCTGKITRHCLFALIRRFAGPNVMPEPEINRRGKSREDMVNLNKAAARRIRPSSIADRVTKTVNSYICKCAKRIMQGKEQVRRYRDIAKKEGSEGYFI